MTDLLAPPDLAGRADVEALLWRFYSTVLVDDVLAEPFSEVREVTGLDEHIPRMADFWETVLFRAGLYRGSALDAHRPVHDWIPLDGHHFIRWLTTWQNTVDEMFSGPVAEHAKVQAARIAWAMHRRLTGGDDDELDALVALLNPPRSGRRARATVAEPAVW